MQTNIIQSLIDRNAAHITSYEFFITECKKAAMDYKRDGYKSIAIDHFKLAYKSSQELKKLVTIQKALKEELRGNIEMDRFFAEEDNYTFGL